jgi:GAF domain-containing protein
VTDTPPIQNSDPAELQRLVDEQRQIVEIGRLVGSTLDIVDVFPQVAGISRELVSADRMVIAVISEDGLELVDRHIHGFIVPEDEFRGRRPISESDAYHSLVIDNVSVVYSGDDLKNYNSNAEEESARKQTGLNALMMTPLIWQGESHGVLAFRAFDSDAFGPHQIELAQQIANQIAGGVASANQYGKLERESLEKEQLAEIRRIAGSSLVLGDIFTPFAKQVRLLVPADRLILTTIDADGAVIDRYVDGVDVRDSITPPKSFVLDASIFEQISENLTHFTSNGEEYEKYVLDRPEEVARYAAGLRAILSLPLVWRGELVGSLTLRSTDPEAFGEQDIEIASLIANQIASAIHAANQYRLLENEALNRKRLGEIGRIVSSTLELDSVLSAFVDTAHELVPFDRLAISLIDAQTGHMSQAKTFRNRTVLT